MAMVIEMVMVMVMKDIYLLFFVLNIFITITIYLFIYLFTYYFKAKPTRASTPPREQKHRLFSRAELSFKHVCCGCCCYLLQ